MRKVNSLCIVDDDPIYVFTTKRTLEKVEFCNSISVYHNGKEAFENLNQLNNAGAALPDMILLDLNMPIWDGWDFLNEFSKLKTSKTIIVYIVTSSKHPDDIRKAKNYQLVRNFIIKPVTVDKLTDALE
jgi:CheY-like chemotaxis protein